MTSNIKTSIKTSLRHFLFQHISPCELSDDDDIFSLGLVNSLFAMQLVTFIEEQYKLTVENHELDLANFNSLDNMANYIDSKHTAATTVS